MSCQFKAVVNEGSWEAPLALLSAGCAALAAAVETKTRHSLHYPTVYCFMSSLFIPPAVLILFLSGGWGKSVGHPLSCSSSPVLLL